MAYALDRQHARLVRAYARLRDLYDKSIRDRALLKDRVDDLQIELRRARRELNEYTSASRNTLGKLFASTQFAIQHLVAAGDLEAAERLSVWLDEMRDSMQPVANVRDIVDTLEEWTQAIESGADQGVVYMKTRMMLREIRGVDGE